MLPEVVRTFIKREQLLRLDGHYLVAVSGGADSVCLLLVLRQLGYCVEAVHCNFMLRNEESQRDEQFVKALCEKESIKLHLTSFDTRTYASLHKVSIEMAARRLRYAYFEQLRHDIGADDICVAHHKDDAVETILLNLTRGTGINGLQGIQPRRGHIVRPLLCVSRNDIEAWLREQQQPFVTDSTNLVPDIARNQLRLNVIPKLQEITPSAIENILSTAHHLAEASKVYDASTRQALDRLLTPSPPLLLPPSSSLLPPSSRLSIAGLLAEPSPECLLFEWLYPLGFTPATIESIFTALLHVKIGDIWQSSKYQLYCHQGHLVVSPLMGGRPTLRIPEAGTYVYEDTHRLRIERREGSVIVRDDVWTCCLDASKVLFPLVLRTTREGDRFQPFGMRGTKLISDYLTDRHLSAVERQHQLVVTDASGNILWLVGYRPDGRYCVGDGTRQTLLLHFF